MFAGVNDAPSNKINSPTPVPATKPLLTMSLSDDVGMLVYLLLEDYAAALIQGWGSTHLPRPAWVTTVATLPANLAQFLLLR